MEYFCGTDRDLCFTATFTCLYVAGHCTTILPVEVVLVALKVVSSCGCTGWGAALPINHRIKTLLASSVVY